MYRLILVSLLLTILYFLLRRMFRGFKTPLQNGRRSPSTQSPDDEQDQMIQDPVCHIFVPRRIALIELIGGREYCFCSKECAGKFRDEHPI
jgi:YHS domain-containing protein